MQTVKAGQHEESAAVDTAAQLEVEFGIGMAVLVNLKAQKREAEQYRQRKKYGQQAAAAVLQCVMGNRQGHTAR